MMTFLLVLAGVFIGVIITCVVVAWWLVTNVKLWD